MRPTKSRKILLISHDFPPSAYIGAKRIAAFSRYLPEFGVTPIVLTVKERFYEACDASIGIPERLTIYRTSVLPNLLTLYPFVKASSSAWRTPRVSSKPKEMKNRSGVLLVNLLAILKAPNDDIGWYLPAVRAAKRIIKVEGVKTILSSGPPWAAHLIARKLKRLYGLQWFADFRDPWTMGAEWDQLPKWRKRMERKLESICITHCDRVICNTDPIRAAFANSYSWLPAEKFLTITNGFDDLKDATGSGKPNNRKLLVHLGSIYGARRNELFFESIARLIDRSELSPLSFKILLVGDGDPVFVDSISKQFPALIRSGCLEFAAQVSWETAQQILWSADVLLLFQGSYTLQIPAKFYEYLQTGKPILAIAEEGALTNVLKLTDSGVSASGHDLSALQAAFLAVLSRERRTSAHLEQRTIRDFHYRALTQRLADLVNENIDE